MEELNNIDSIVEQSEVSTNQEIPMQAEPNQAPQEAQTTPQIQEYEFQVNGQQVKAPIEKILKWASMGHSAPQRIGELSKKLSDYEGRFKQYEQYEKTYKPVDEWAKANPDKWQTLIKTWQQAQYGVMPQGQQANPEQQQFNLPPEVIQKLQAHDQFIAQTQQERQQQLQKEQIQRDQATDRNLDGEIQSIRKQNPNIDFDAPDKLGNSLEYQILEHATKNGIPSFRAAFRDYCFPQLAQFSQEKGREQAGKVSPQTRAGLLGKPQAQATSQATPDLKNRNYDQIHELILSQLGL